MARATPLSTELALLASCVLDTDGVVSARVEEALRKGIDWDRFERLAIDHGMAGLAGDRFAAIMPGVLPAPLAQRLRRILQQQAVIQLAQTAETARLLRLLSDGGIRALVIKGVALAHMLYPEQPAWRSSTDIDLLIEPTALFDADQLLRDAGYQRTAPEAEPPAAGAGRDMFLHLDNVFNYVHPDHGQLIELHHRLTLNPHWIPVDFDQLYASSTLIDTEFGNLRGLSGPINLAYLCWHALSHYRFLLMWIGDIERAIRLAQSETGAACFSGDPPEFSLRPVWVVDSLIAALTGRWATRAGRADQTRWEREATDIAQRMEYPSAFPTARSFSRLPREIAFQLFLMRLSDRLPGKAYQILHTAADPRDIYTLGLSRKWTALYAALGPVFAAGRFAARPWRQMPTAK